MVVRVQERMERERTKKDSSTLSEQDIPRELLCGLTGDTREFVESVCCLLVLLQ